MARDFGAQQVVEFLAEATEEDLLVVYNEARRQLISRQDHEADEVNGEAGLRKRARVEVPDPQPRPAAGGLSRLQRARRTLSEYIRDGH